MWNEGHYYIITLMKVIITFTFCCNNLWKVSLWLWKSLKNSGNFFLLLCGYPVKYFGHMVPARSLYTKVLEGCIEGERREGRPKVDRWCQRLDKHKLMWGWQEPASSREMWFGTPLVMRMELHDDNEAKRSKYSSVVSDVVPLNPTHWLIQCSVLFLRAKPTPW